MRSPKNTLTSIPFILLMLFVLSFTHNKPVPQQETQQADKKEPSFLFLSDIHLNTQTDTTTYGNDTGMDLWRQFLAKADEVIKETHPQFVVYTGDLPAHYLCDSSCYLPPASRATHNQNLSTILTGMRNLADKHHLPFFYMPGNNDGLAGDYYSFADELQQTPLSLVPDSANPYPALNIVAGNKAPCLVSMPHPTMGYYSARPVKDLRLVCLNTVIYSKKFTAVDGSQPDSDRLIQMNWLAAQLAEARAMKEKVYIAMHIPPGMDAYSNKPMWDKGKNGTSWLNMFLALTSTYKDDISGILYGHTHMDEVRRLYDSTGKNITEVAISCPGVTPQHMNNPGFKTVTFDEGNKELTGFTTYYTRLGLNSWGTSTYTFDSVFSNKHHHTIYQRLAAMSLHKVGNAVKSVYTVMNQPTSYKSVKEGIEVKWE